MEWWCTIYISVAKDSVISIYNIVQGVQQNYSCSTYGAPYTTTTIILTTTYYYIRKSVHQKCMIIILYYIQLTLLESEWCKRKNGETFCLFFSCFFLFKKELCFLMIVCPFFGVLFLIFVTKSATYDWFLLLCWEKKCVCKYVVREKMEKKILTTKYLSLKKTFLNSCEY